MRKTYSYLILIGLFIVLAGTIVIHLGKKNQPHIAFLHAKTDLDTQALHAGLLALEEINAQRSMFSQIIAHTVQLPEHDTDLFAEQARLLIQQKNICAFFGCLKSEQRKKVGPVIESMNSLLFCPAQTEGLDDSLSTVYMGASPNQQTVPGVMWSFNNLGKKFLLVGDSSLYAYITHRIIKDFIVSLGGSIIGEFFITTKTHIDTIIEHIKNNPPDTILNNITQTDIHALLFKALYQADISPENTPVMAFVLSPQDILAIGLKYCIGHFIVANYLNSIPTKKNYEFIQKYQHKYGKDHYTSDTIVEEYNAVHLWAQTITKKQTSNPLVIKEALNGQSFDAPEGPIALNKENNVWETVRVGKIADQGEIHILWDSEKPIQPEAFPRFKTKQEWLTILKTFIHNDKGSV